jgi:hypothetical protein
MLTKNLVILCVFILSATLAGKAMAERRSSHIYINGKVTSVSGSSITVERAKFPFAPNLKVTLRDKVNDAFFESPALLNYVHAGANVTLRVRGRIVNEINIERWKR